MSTLAAVRLVTGPVRPPGKHGCPPVELLPGLWTAHFEDVATLEQLRAAAPGVALVVNTADDKCKTSEGSYGTDIHVLVVGGLLDDPEERKHVDAMAEGPAKDAARAALPTFPAAECAGDAKKDFTRVNEAVEQALARGEGAVIHCYASISRSAAFVLAFLMKTRAAELVKPKWDALWPADAFVEQLQAYEAELTAQRAAMGGA